MIVEALHAARVADSDRGDGQHAHVADLYGCDRATWYRRNSYDAPDYDAAKLRKFDVGNAVEAHIVNRLRASGVRVMTGYKVILRVNPVRGALIGAFATEDEYPLCDEVLGHPDAIVDDGEQTLLEIKTTDARKVADVVSPHYALQAAAYALAVSAPRAIVHVTHVANFAKDEIEYAIDPEQYRERVTERVRDVTAKTLPGAPLPPPQPARESAAWACKYCAYLSQCSMDGGPA